MANPGQIIRGALTQPPVPQKSQAQLDSEALQAKEAAWQQKVDKVKQFAEPFKRLIKNKGVFQQDQIDSLHEGVRNKVIGESNG